MWRRSLTWLGALLAAALLLSGCMAKHDFMAMESAAQPPYEPPAAAEPDRAQRARLAADIDRAVGLIAQLRYAPAAEILHGWTAELDSYPDIPRQAEAWFWLAYCREKQGRLDEARRLYTYVLDRYPRRPAAAQAHRRLNRLKPNSR